MKLNLDELEDIVMGHKYSEAERILRDGTVLPQLLRTLRAYEQAIEKVRKIEIEPYCSERLGKCNCTDYHELQNSMLNNFDEQRDTILQQLEEELKKI